MFLALLMRKSCPTPVKTEPLLSRGCGRGGDGVGGSYLRDIPWEFINLGKLPPLKALSRWPRNKSSPILEGNGAGVGSLWRKQEPFWLETQAQRWPPNLPLVCFMSLNWFTVSNVTQEATLNMKFNTSLPFASLLMNIAHDKLVADVS